MDEEDAASNLKLGLETQGTADEVDSSEIRPAPAPTAEELQNISVDVSSSQPLESHPEPPADGFATLDDRIEGAPPTELTGDALHAAMEEVMLDEALDYADNSGSQSPATRTLELPPALDLSQSQDPTYESSEGALGKYLDTGPLTSPTTEAAVDQATQNAEAGISPAAQGQEQPQQQPQGPNTAGKWSLPPPPPKPPVFTYVHDDSDTAMAELEEFFSYVEVRGVVEEGREAWSRGWEAMSDTKWVDASISTKKAHVYHLIEELEHRDPEIRFEASRRLAYIAQAGALTAVHEALKSASGRWNIISSMPDAEPNAYGQSQSYFPSLTPQERQEYLEEINGELAVHLSILYFMLEILRGDPSWADDLISLDPPLPIYLFSLVAGLREKNAKGYPVKKLLLLLWKSLLACLGGHKDIKRVKRLVRKIEGLPKDFVDDSHISMKTGPLDFATFKGEILSKYPTYEPPNIVAPIPQIPLDRIVAAAASAPLRQSYQLRSATHNHPAQDGSAPNTSMPQAPMPATPAPTPPPSPPPMKPKKQQYQTDQSKPFVLPFSRANVGGGHYSKMKGKGKMTVPFSIDEAGKLYQKNFRISTELWQTWKLREEYLADETGFGSDHSKQHVEDDVQSQRINALARHFEATSLEDNPNGAKARKVAENETEKPVDQDALSMLYQLEGKFKANLKAHKKSVPPSEQNSEFNKRTRKLTQRVEDVKRLQRVELIYRSTLNHMHSAVIVLLKLLLATVTANTNATTNASEDEGTPYLNLEETDIMRHREITSKAVSAILILTLRWFKTSHAMKFHYLAHLLVDSNCLLLILKMFGLQEVLQQVQTKNEVPDWNFFQFCHLYGSANPAPSASAQPVRVVQRAVPLKQPGSEGELKSTDEPEVITSFSYRNFFSVINFVHVLQKLTKRKPHRILLLVQYKSSAILKRILKVSHPLLQLYVLKVIKSQIPYSGRKWRQSNMKVITAIYLNCRPDLRDEWLTTIDIDNDLDESMPHEQTLRTLVHFFNSKHYGSFAPHLHRRLSSHSAGNAPPFENHGPGTQFGGQEQGYQSHNAAGQPPPSPLSAFALGHHQQSFFDSESFPPARPLSMFAGEDHYRTSYIPDSLMDGYLEDYEELLGDLFTPSYDTNGMPLTAGTPPFSGSALASSMSGGMSPSRALGESMGPAYLSNAEQAWHRLGEILGEADSISDSESVTSIGYLDVASDSDVSDITADDERAPGTNDWEHLSPDLATALEDERERQEYEERLERASPGRRKRTSSPHSPRLRRSSSGTPRSPALRPVLIDMDSQDDNEEYDDSAIEEEEDDPLPKLRSPRRSPHLSPSKVAIDEVEAFWPDEDPM